MDPLNARDAGSHVGGPSYPLHHRAFRAGWSLVWTLLAAWTPPPLHGWRRFLLRLFGAKVASTARIYGSTRIWYPPNLEIGEHSVLGSESRCYCMNTISIGDHVTVSQFSQLLGGTHSIEDPYFQLTTFPIRIESKAWVATCAVVGPGVTIGEGAVLGAGAVAFKDLAPWTVYVGNPAQPVKSRTPY